jgi:hypothetical protein
MLCNIKIRAKKIYIGQTVLGGHERKRKTPILLCFDQKAIRQMIIPFYWSFSDFLIGQI